VKGRHNITKYVANKLHSQVLHFISCMKVLYDGQILRDLMNLFSTLWTNTDKSEILLVWTFHKKYDQVISELKHVDGHALSITHSLYTLHTKNT